MKPFLLARYGSALLRGAVSPFIPGQSRLRYTLRRWPTITIVTIGLCFLTQQGAKICGIDLPDQKNIEVVRELFRQAFSSGRHFAFCALNVVLVLGIMPAVEELFFRGLLYGLPTKRVLNKGLIFALVSSAVFSAAHYITQPWPDNAFVALFFFGLAQCWLYRQTGRLWCAILNHALFNLTNLVLLFL